MGQDIEMAAASSADPSGKFCSVAEAAGLLGCTPQTVRNRLDSGELRGRRIRRGRRDVRTVEVSSIEAYVREHPPIRQTSQLSELRERVRRLEAEYRVPDDSVDPVNLRFTNLQLLVINEKYERALREVLAADVHKQNALALLQQAAAEFRATVEQFHLPATPPDDD